MANSGKIQKPKEFTETRKIMLNYLCMLSALLVAAVYTYGLRTLVIAVISVSVTVACKKLCEAITKSEYPHGDLSGLVTGLMIALLMPSTVPYYIPVFAGIFAVVVCMLPFGTAKNSPFVPAAAAICFVTFCFSDKMFLYPSIQNGEFVADKIGTSLTSLLSSGTSVRINSAVVLQILTGQMPSALGTGFIIILFGALLFLLIRYPKNALPSLMFLLSSALFACVFPRVSTGAVSSITMEMCGGILLFSAVFFMSYPSVIPSRTVSSLIWGFVSGIVCMAFRYFGRFEDSLIFGILIMNGTASLFDELPLTKYEKKKLEESVPYEQTTEPEGIVPEEILNEIPDISDEEIIAQDEEPQAEGVCADGLHEVISTENEIDETSPSIILGGGSNE